MNETSLAGTRFVPHETTAVKAKERDRAEIERLTAEYLARGNQIDQVLDHTRNATFNQPAKRTAAQVTEDLRRDSFRRAESVAARRRNFNRERLHERPGGQP